MKISKRGLLKSVLFILIAVAGFGVAYQVKGQKSGPRLYNSNIQNMNAVLSQYEDSSSRSFRSNAGETYDSRSAAISDYLKQRAGIVIAPELLKANETGIDSGLTADGLADVILDQGFDRIQKAEPKAFVAFLRGVADNRGPFMYLDSRGRATIIGKNDMLCGLGFARKNGDRETLKAFAKPVVREAIETTAAYYSQASPEFKRNTVEGTRFSAPEALLLSYSLLANDFATVQPNKPGAKVCGLGGTMNQFPVEFFITPEFASRLKAGR